MKLLYISALKGQKHDKCFNAFALTGRMYSPLPTQGVALGYWFIGLSGRSKAHPKVEYLISGCAVYESHTYEKVERASTGLYYQGAVYHGYAERRMGIQAIRTNNVIMSVVSEVLSS